MIVRVRAKRPRGFIRAGVHWPTTWVEHECDEATVKILEAEKHLQVVRVKSRSEDVPAAEPTPAAPERREERTKRPGRPVRPANIEGFAVRHEPRELGEGAPAEVGEELEHEDPVEPDPEDDDAVDGDRRLEVEDSPSEGGTQGRRGKRRRR